MDVFSEAAGATHRTVIARFAPGLDTAGFLFLKEIDKFRDGSFFNAEAILARVQI
jgi:hypothetical protein